MRAPAYGGHSWPRSCPGSSRTDSLVAGARDPIATRANLAELRALISLRGFRPNMQFSRGELRRLAVPTLMIWGDRDPVVPLAQARSAAAEIAHARLEVLPAGHVPQLGHPDRVVALLDEFATTTPRANG